MNGSAPILDVRSLVVGYGHSSVLHEVDVSVVENEAVAVLGPNGAGKSTLLKCISGFVRPSAGTVGFDGADLGRCPPHRRVAMGIVHVPEGRQVFPEMTVRDNLLMGGFTKPDGIDDRLTSVLETFPRLGERLKQDAATLSGGEQQMLAIGRGLMSVPKLLLLDEPTLGLAPILVDDLLDRLRAVRKTLRTPMLVVEQNAYLATELCDRYAVLTNGRVTAASERMPEDSQELIDAYLG